MQEAILDSFCINSIRQQKSADCTYIVVKFTIKKKKKNLGDRAAAHFDKGTKMSLNYTKRLGKERDME